MGSEAYDLRSNIKGKPGGQGTLFQVKDKSLLNGRLRWPRGYTPERLNEVRGALRSTYVAPPEHLDPAHEDSQYEPGEYHGVMGYKESHIIPPIARSTIPAEHLHGLNVIGEHPDHNDVGTYWPNRKEIGIDMTEKGRDRTLIHELGHHHVNMSDEADAAVQRHVREAGTSYAQKNFTSQFHPTPTGSGIAMGEEAVEAGVHEAHADNYMVEHYRSPGRKPKTATEGQYEQNFTSDRLDQAYPGYTDVRPKQPGPTYRALQEKQFSALQGKSF